MLVAADIRREQAKRKKVSAMGAVAREMRRARLAHPVGGSCSSSGSRSVDQRVRKRDKQNIPVESIAGSRLASRAAKRTKKEHAYV